MVMEHQYKVGDTFLLSQRLQEHPPGSIATVVSLLEGGDYNIRWEGEQGVSKYQYSLLKCFWQKLEDGPW